MEILVTLREPGLATEPVKSQFHGPQDIDGTQGLTVPQVVIPEKAIAQKISSHHWLPPRCLVFIVLKFTSDWPACAGVLRFRPMRASPPVSAGLRCHWLNH